MIGRKQRVSGGSYESCVWKAYVGIQNRQIFLDTRHNSLFVALLLHLDNLRCVVCLNRSPCHHERFNEGGHKGPLPTPSHCSPPPCSSQQQQCELLRFSFVIFNLGHGNVVCWQWWRYNKIATAQCSNAIIRWISSETKGE